MRVHVQVEPLMLLLSEFGPLVVHGCWVRTAVRKARRHGLVHRVAVCTTRTRGRYVPAETVGVSKGTTLVPVPDVVANTDTGSDRATNY